MACLGKRERKESEGVRPGKMGGGRRGEGEGKCFKVIEGGRE